MKKTVYSIAFLITFMLISVIQAYAITEADRDTYDHKYYQQSVNNGGINRAPNESDHNFNVAFNSHRTV